MFSGPVWAGINGKKRNSAVNEREKKHSTLRSPHTVSVSPVPKFLVIFKGYDDDNDVITELVL